MGQEFFRFRANQTARPVSIGSGLTFTSEKEVDGMKEETKKTTEVSEILRSSEK